MTISRLALIAASFVPLLSADCFGEVKTFALSIKDAEYRALRTSHILKAAELEATAADEQAQAQTASLLPRLSFQAGYQYFGAIPLIAIGSGPAIPFGTNSTYSIGPAVSYTLWDGFASRKSEQSAGRLAEARQEDRRNREAQLLYSLRSTYIQVQLAVEEMRLTNESLAVARAQDRDIAHRYKAGGASRLEQVTARRGTVGYEIQFEQKQAQLATILKDLLALLDEPQITELSRPGPEGVEGVSLIIRLDPFQAMLEAEEPREIPPPDQHNPQVRSLARQAEALELLADSQAARRLPAIQLIGSVTRQRPNVPNPPDFTQETVAASLSMPLFLGDPTPRLAAQQRSEAQAVAQREEQVRIDLQRDFVKGQAMLASLHNQQKLAAEDVTQSAEAASLYLTSYRAGKINLTDVQAANLLALQARVNAARIDAQILGQRARLKALAGVEIKESSHD